MSPDYRRRSPAPASSTPQRSSDTGTAQAAGAGNAAAQEAMQGGGEARKTNLAFGFNESDLRSRNYKPAALKNEILDRLHVQKMEHTKDGAELTDTEKLYVVAKLLSDHGYQGARLAGMIEGMFFDGGGSSSADDVRQVIVSGGEVRIEFGTSSGYHMVAGKILPIIATPPADYEGQDTNVRGAMVGNLQNLESTDNITRTNTFMAREHEAVTAAFLESREGSKFKLNPARFPPSSAEYREAFRDFEIGLMISYIEKASYWVKEQLGEVDGRSAEELLSEALDLAMQYTNPNLCAEGHTEIELQDEAIAQRVLSELGFDGMDVDTDAENQRLGIH